MDFNLAFTPLIGFWALTAFAILAGIAIIALALFRPRGWLLRGGALAMLLLAIANPSLTHEDREKLTSVLAVVVDKSASQSLDQRDVRTTDALREVEERAKRLPDTEVRVIEGAAPSSGSDGTELFKALQAGLADVPPDRVAGAVLRSE